MHLAENRNVSLAVGFNPRHAPGYVACSDHPRDLILMQKNRVGLPEEPRKMILDDFIHVVDTLRFLVPGTVDDVTVRPASRAACCTTWCCSCPAKDSPR